MESNIDAEASYLTMRLTTPAPMVVVEGTKKRHGARFQRLSWVAMAALVAFPTAIAGSPPAAAAEPSAPASSYSPSDQTGGSTVAPPESAPIMLSDQQRQVSAIADKNGDRNYLMIDKIGGTITLFQDGKPVFSGSALTGENTADRLPPDASSRKYARMDPFEYRVTPAGRFTARRYTDEFSRQSLKFNEVRGPDWVLSLNEVYLGRQSERWGERLKTSGSDDNNITRGGISVSGETIQRLMEKLPQEGTTPIYILPHDRANTAAYFAPATGAGSPAPASGPADTGATGKDTAQAEPGTIENPLSPQELHVSRIAANNGDQTYLMVNKLLGWIILFENDSPVFIAPALTGQSLGDTIPPSAFKKTFTTVDSKDDKVTPAGRFTLSRDYDKSYGHLLEIKEIQGPDWAIAIHRVYVGTPAERRVFRMDTRDSRDNHVSHGCINVSKETIEFLLRKLPPKPAAVLYVLPYDTSKTEAFLARRGGV